MYFWLQEYEGGDVYVINDASEKVYIIDDDIAFLQKMSQQQLLRFKPYLEKIKETKSFDFKVIE